MTDKPQPAARRSDAAVAEAAAFWSERLREAGADPQLRVACDAWLGEDPRHGQALARADAAWATARMIAEEPEALSLRNEVLARAAAGRKRGRYLLPAAAAASLLIAVTAVVLQTTHAPMKGPPSGNAVAAGPAAFTQSAGGEPRTQYATAVGERFTATLPDDTVMTLNTASHARIDYSDSARRVVLLSGQAYFDVAHETDRPFIVEAQGREIVALGTAFDVSLVGGGVTVTLVEGRVTVDPDAAAPGSVEGVGAVEIVAGQQWTERPQADAPEVRTVDTRRMTAWTQGNIVLENDTLAHAVAEMNRYSMRPIVIADPALAELRISGVFGAGQPGAFAEALADYFPEIEPQETASEITLTRAF